MPVELRYYQEELLKETENQWALGRNGVMVMSPTGSGKCLGRNTPVLMFDGTIKMVQDVVVGDQIMGPDSSPRNVLSTTTGSEMLYRVIPVKGDPYVVNESHILSLKPTKRRNIPRHPCDEYDPDGIVNVSVREYITKSETWRHVHKGWRAAVEFPSREFDPVLPPYMLGLWLGDGDSHTPTITSMDDETLGYVYDLWTQNGLGLRISYHSAQNKAVQLHATTGKDAGQARYGRNRLTSALRKYDLVGNKHIPHDYMTADTAQRLELLAGLMDSDGHLSKGYFDFVSIYKHLAEQVCYVARSVGFAAYMKSCEKRDQNGQGGTYWRVSIAGDVRRIPCKLPRKQATPRKQKKSVLVTGITVEAIGIGDYYGFEIDGDRLFLLGDFTVTHNTIVIAEAIRRHKGASCVIAHRSVLVSQLSIALAKLGVKHRIIGSMKDQRAIAAEHVAELGRVFVDPSSPCAVASAQTLAKKDGIEKWCASVTLAIVDESQHTLRSGTWGKCLDRFTHPARKLLLPTATPIRADGKGLGSHHDGFADVLVALADDGDRLTVRVALPGESVTCAPSKVLMNQGFLSRYRVACVESHLTEFLGEVAESGDWSQAQLKSAAGQSSIVGDVVQSYRQFADGKIGITFTTDVETASNIAKAYRAAGIPAEVLTGETEHGVRRAIMKRFVERKIMQIVAVDVISEGYDVPNMEVVTFARPTASLGLFLQQLGRAIRPKSDGSHAILIDHVGNFLRHRGGPDTPRTWSLDRRDKRAPKERDAIPIRVCLNVACGQPYERHMDACPFCGEPAPEPDRRGPPEAVDGVLALMDEETLARLRGEVPMGADEYLAAQLATGLPVRYAHANAKKHKERLGVLEDLKGVMGILGGKWKAEGLSDTEMQRKFHFLFQVDVLTAQTLDRENAEKLLERVLTATSS